MQVKNVKKLDWIDFGRCIAILLVIMIHTGQAFPTSLILRNITHSGDMGVQLFFILSAFTLFTSYSSRYELDGSDRNKFFFIRRIFRIAPLYTVAAFFYTLIEIILHGWHSVQYWKVLVSIVYLNGIILPAISYIPPGGWSVGTEMLFYLTIPFLFLKVNTFRKAFYFLVFTILFSNLVNIIDKTIVDRFTSLNYNSGSIRGWYLYFWFPNQLPVFAFGIFLYQAFEGFVISKFFRRMSMAISIVLFFVFAQFPFSLEYPNYFFQREYVYAATFSLFIIGLPALDFKNIFSQIFLKIGKYSFSMYLAHFFVIECCLSVFNHFFHIKSGDINYLIFYIVVVFLTYLLSAALYRFEKKGIVYGNKLIDRIKIKQQSKNTVADIV